MAGELKVEPYVADWRWGILNPYGQIWSCSTFASEKAAVQYVRDFWNGDRTDAELARFKPVRVIVTIALSPSPNEGK